MYAFLLFSRNIMSQKFCEINYLQTNFTLNWFDEIFSRAWRISFFHNSTELRKSIFSSLHFFFAEIPWNHRIYYSTTFHCFHEIFSKPCKSVRDFIVFLSLEKAKNSLPRENISWNQNDECVERLISRNFVTILK